MGIQRRKDLKPRKEISDEAFLRAAQASATRAAGRAAKERRREATEAEIRGTGVATRGEAGVRPPTGGRPGPLG